MYHVISTHRALSTRWRRETAIVLRRVATRAVQGSHPDAPRGELRAKPYDGRLGRDVCVCVCARVGLLCSVCRDDMVHKEWVA